jgi:transmembrane sensor
MIAFHDTRLGEAIEAIDASASGRIRLADPALADRRITGAFRVGDTEAFAQGVGAALELEVARGTDGSLWLRAPPDRAAVH